MQREVRLYCLYRNVGRPDPSDTARHTDRVILSPQLWAVSAPTTIAHAAIYLAYAQDMKGHLKGNLAGRVMNLLAFSAAVPLTGHSRSER